MEPNLQLYKCWGMKLQNMSLEKEKNKQTWMNFLNPG
jgi:hypothetical protein